MYCQRNTLYAKKNKVVVDKSILKRKQEALITCETIADKLLEAAKLKSYDSMLLPIEDLDPVCIEVSYHASCYKQYIKCVFSAKDTLGRLLAKTFDKFYQDVIDKRIISDGEVLRISLLTELFISLALKVEGVNIAGYCNDQIKQRLRRRYPNLKYVRLNPTTCEFVFHQTQDEETIIHFGQHYHDDSEKIDSTSDVETGNNSQDFDYQELRDPADNVHSNQEQFAQLFSAAVII